MSRSDVKKAAAAAAEARKPPGERCWICGHPPVQKWVHEWMDLWALGAVECYIAGLFEDLQTRFDYPRQVQALRQHCERHEPDLWKRRDGP